MNFAPATVSGRTVSLPFATFDLPDAVADVLEDNQLLIAGIRPEHFEDATMVDDSRRDHGVIFSAHVDVTEWLGSELFAYVPFEAHPEVTDKLKSLARELDSESLRTQLVAAIDANSQIEADKEAKLWFDSSKMHFFDPATGENLTRDLVAVSA